MTYDYIFVTHLPSFYKVNLYNEIAKSCRVFVIFIASGSTIRNSDFTQKQYQFDYMILNEGAFEQRPQLKSSLKIIAKIRAMQYRHIVVGGWDLIEYWAVALLFAKNKNALALESSVFESQSVGFKAAIKTFFLNRMSTVFSSGQPHHALLKQLQFQGKINETLGVGLMNYHEAAQTTRSFQGRFLYVGRYAPEKNLFLLIEAMRACPQFSLTMIGGGPQKEALLAAKPDNVTIQDHLPNHALQQAYLSHDVFILPSLKEPWGLVVEEALYYGMPVIVSDKVGSGPDLVLAHQVGLQFEASSTASLVQAMSTIEKDYTRYCQHAHALDLQQKDQQQVQRYLEVLA
jgi:glycosyltransferase involved in cell wall biosynthesis